MLGLDSFLASTCCPTAPPPQASLLLQGISSLNFTSLSLFLSYIFGLMGLLWSETLHLFLSLYPKTEMTISFSLFI